jgi:hypothetical protein
LEAFPSNLIARLQKRGARSPYALVEEQRMEIDAPLAFRF